MRFYWMNDRVKQKRFLFYWKARNQDIWNYFMKHHPPHHHIKICATYLYMANSLLIIDHKIVQKWANAVLTPIHTVSVGPMHKARRTFFLQALSFECTSKLCITFLDQFQFIFVFKECTIQFSH